MAKARKWKETSASSSEEYAASGALIFSREDFDILNQQLSHGSAAEALQRKGTVETCLVLMVPPGQGPAAVGLQGKFVCCLLMCSVKDLQAPSCPPVCELLSLCLQW